MNNNNQNTWVDAPPVSQHKNTIISVGDGRFSGRLHAYLKKNIDYKINNHNTQRHLTITWQTQQAISGGPVLARLHGCRHRSFGAFTTHLEAHIFTQRVLLGL